MTLVKEPQKAANTGTGLLHEMLRSFVSLADTLNLSRTVRDVGSTRQTVRRHIALLEEARGVSLFSVVDRQYELTDEGERALPEAKELLARGGAWLSGVSSEVDEMFHLHLENHPGMPEGFYYHLQQKPLGEIWERDDSIRRALEVWSGSHAQVEHESFEDIRPVSLVFREHGAEWICVEIGEESAFAQWFGPSWARSQVGRPLAGLPGGESFAWLMMQPYHDARIQQGLRYDHINTQIVRADREGLSPVAYHRLLMHFRYPDKSDVLVSVVEHVDAQKTADL